MKKLLLSFALLNLVCPFAHASENQKVESEKNSWGDRAFSSDKAWDKASVESLKYSKQPICNEPLTVIIANLKLSMPRKGATFYTDDGKIYMDMGHRCEIKSLENVKTISTSLFFLTSVHDGYKTMYEMNRLRIDQFRLSEMSVRLEDGIERLGNKEAYIYVVPQEIIKTDDGASASFYCKRHTLWPMSPETEAHLDAGYIGMFGECRTGYFIRPNLIADYRVFGFLPSWEGKKDHDKQLKESAKMPTEFFIKEYAKFIERDLNSYIVKE